MPQNRHPYLCLSFYLALQPGRDPKPLEHRCVVPSGDPYERPGGRRHFPSLRDAVLVRHEGG